MEIEYSLSDKHPDSYYLSIITNERKYSILVTNDHFNSTFIDIADLKKVLLKDNIEGIDHSVIFSENEKKTELTLEIEVFFQKSQRLKRIKESFIIVLPRVKRDIYMEQIVTLRDENKKIRTQLQESEEKLKSSKEEIQNLRNLLKHLSGVYDPLLDDLKVERRINHTRFNLDVDCFDYVNKHPRFEKYSRLFSISKQNISDLSLVITTKLPDGIGIVSLSDIFYTGEGNKLVGFKPFKIIQKEFNKLNEMSLERKTNTQIVWESMITLYELIAQYELRNKILYPKSVNGFMMRSVDTSEYLNEFNMLTFINSPWKLQEQEYFWSETVGFYKTIQK